MLVFVGIGRSVHAHGVSIGGLASTAWPFLSGLLVAWVALALAHRDAATLSSGAVICVVTVAVGMVLRVVSGQGTAFAFVLVALGFLGATMDGWRLMALLVRARCPRPTVRDDRR